MCVCVDGTPLSVMYRLHINSFTVSEDRADDAGPEEEEEVMGPRGEREECEKKKNCFHSHPLTVIPRDDTSWDL